MKPSLTRRCWLVLLSLALAACDLPGGTPVAATTGLRVWLDQPPDGATLPVGTFRLRAHARDAGGSGVVTITFLVSSGGPPVTVGSVTTDPALPLVTADFDWNPSAPGEYAIQAQAFDRLGYVFSVPARVCVGLERAAGGGCAVAGRKLQGLVLTDLNADGNGTDASEGPLAGVLVTLSGCDSQTAHTNPPSSDPAYPEGVFAFGLASLSGCSIQVSLAGWRFESFEGSAAYPIAWPANEDPHTILMAPAGPGTATSTSTTTNTPQPPTATDKPTPAGQTPPSATPTKTAFASATPTKPAFASATPTKPALPNATPTKTAVPTDTPTTVVPPSDTPKPVDTKPPTPTATTAPSATPTPTDTQPPADTSAPAIDKVFAGPNPTFYGNSCSKGQAQFTAGATVTDPSGVASVTFYYRYGVGATTGPWQSVAMSAAGGDQYTATVFNDAAAVYKLLGGAEGYVEFYVQAKDTPGNVGQSPSPVITIQYCVG